MSDALKRGIQYLKGGFPLAAIQELEFALVENKYLWDAYYYLAEAHLKRAKEVQSKEDLWKSLHILESLEVLNPDYPADKMAALREEIEKTFHEFGMALLDEVTLAEATLLEDPHAAGAHQRISERRGEGPKTRIRRFRKVVASDPANLFALSQLAKAYEESESYLMAQKIYEQMIQYTLGLELSHQFFASEPLEKIAQAVKWWAQQVSPAGMADQESLELMRAMHRLSQLYQKRGELEKAYVLFTGALDLAIEVGGLAAMAPHFNSYLDLCIQTGHFQEARERLPFFKRELKEMHQESQLDPLLLSLVESYEEKKENNF